MQIQMFHMVPFMKFVCSVLLQKLFSEKVISTTKKVIKYIILSTKFKEDKQHTVKSYAFSDT